MKKAVVPFSEELKFNCEHSLTIDTYKWTDNDYKPIVEVFLCHNNDKLKVKFIAYEKDIYIKSFEDNGRIWCDSCVEFFIRPFEDDERYINFEINPVRAMIMSIGEDRNERKALVFDYKSQLNVKTDSHSGFWTVQFEISFDMLCKIFENKKRLKSGDTIYGNFYKCGDETPDPHFGMWNEIDGPPNFHQSQYFGELILK